MGRPRKYRTEAERRRAHAEASRRYRISRGQPKVRRRMTPDEEAARHRVGQRRYRRRVGLGLLSYGLDAFAPGVYWYVKLALIERYQEAVWDAWARNPTLPPIPLPEPFETDIVEKRAVEVLNEERARIRRIETERFGSLESDWHSLSHPERYTPEQRADAAVMECFVPRSKDDRMADGIVERWGWSNPKRPLSDYAEDLAEIKSALRGGTRIRFSWEPPLEEQEAWDSDYAERFSWKPPFEEHEDMDYVYAKQALENFERDWWREARLVEEWTLHDIRRGTYDETTEMEQKREIEEAKGYAIGYLLKNGRPSGNYPVGDGRVNWYCGLETALG